MNFFLPFCSGMIFGILLSACFFYREFIKTRQARDRYYAVMDAQNAAEGMPPHE